MDQSPTMSSMESTATCSAGGGISSSTMSSLFMVVLGGGLASFVRTTMLNRAQDSIASRLRSKAFYSILIQHDVEWFQQEQQVVGSSSTATSSTSSSSTTTPTSSTTMTPAAMIHILQQDVTMVSHSITGNLANLIRSSCSCLFGTFHMLTLNPSLFGVSATIVPLIGTAAMVLRKLVQHVAKQQRHIETIAASFAQERLQYVQMVKMSHKEMDEVTTYTNYQKQVVQLGRTVSLANGAFMGFIFAASSGALFAVFHQGGRCVAAGTMTAGELTSFATYTFLLGLGTSGVFKALSEMSLCMVAAERVYKLMDVATTTGSETISSCTTTTADDVPVDTSSITSLSLQNVSFSYKANPDTVVLNQISMELKRGTVVALVGQNGAGKTTIASLLAALYVPTTGSIVLNDGTNYSKLSRNIQRKLVQVVPQDPALFNMSILENVRYSTPNATDDQVKVAMELANCTEFVTKLGMSYNVGLSGNKLSGGQRQRLGLARALLVDPTILVLDEPTSSLDHQGETAVADAVEACRMENRGLLLITHRTKSLELADVVVVLKDGMVVESGTFCDLTANKESELCALMPDLM